MNIYETDRLLSEYLLFHYGSASEVLPYKFGPMDALGYPARCVAECLDTRCLPGSARALDLGCAVGRSTFELARHAEEVVGIDYSQAFIRAAETLRTVGQLSYERVDEGELRTPLMAHRPVDVNAARISFETGDAMALREDLGRFDVVLMANLIDRLREPRRCLERLPELVNPGGQLIITSPYTWMEDFTPRAQWLGGFEREGQRVTTLDGLQNVLAGSFELVATRDLPFLIREHARKFQWSVAQATLWIRR